MRVHANRLAGMHYAVKNIAVTNGCSLRMGTGVHDMSHFETRESTVIIVDDEPSIRDALEVLVTATGYRCMSFASGEAFLARPLPRVPHCLLLDLRLEDGRNGLEIQSELNARGATLPVLFLSAEDDVASRSEEHTSELQSRFELVCRL